ncbi:hypothetical protein VNI00_006834 [Paramarasmius palmivorus]|uniref:F-box domain-containing protein n=1 Tax=Paramarasmius palmivorus TaxID=297713 RepID=A0AAW0D6Z8_9AGAR
MPSINTIPVELLIYIFEYCEPTSILDDTVQLPTLESASTVCRRWRTTTLAAPYLWKTIILLNPRRHHVLMVQRWLERSARCPLTLELSMDPEDAKLPALWTEIQHSMRDILNLLVRHIHRWQSALLDLSQFNSFPELPLSPDAAPLLESVEVGEEMTFPSEDASARFWHALLLYPSLRNLIWRPVLNQDAFLGPSVYAQGWSKVTHLEGRFAIDDNFIHALSRCWSLRSLDIFQTSSNPSPATAHQVIFLPHLRMLRFDTSSRQPLWFLDRLFLPRLEELEIHPLQMQCRPLIDLLTRSSCSLDSIYFAFHSDFTSAEALDDLFSLRAFSRLTELRFSALGNSSDAVKGLTLRPDDNNCLPCVEAMFLGLQNCEDGLLEAMVKSRLGAQDSPFQYVWISHTLGEGEQDAEYEPKSSADARFLEEICEEGFIVRYSGP